MNPKRKRHEGTHYLSCRQFSGSTFGRLVSKWKNYFNYCRALNYSLWRKWWQVCGAPTPPLPLASLSVLMKKPLPQHTDRDREERRGVVADSQICCNDWEPFFFFFFFILTPIQGQLELQGSRLSQNLETETGRKIFFQRLKINWTRFLLLNLLTACHPINSPSVLLCCGLPQGLKLKSEMLSQIFPQQTLVNVMWGNILLLYLLRKIPKGRCILLMPALAPC